MTDEMHLNWDVIVRHIRNKATEAEKQLLELWLDEDPLNRIYYEKAKYYFEHYYSGEASRTVYMEDAWQEFVSYAGKSRKITWRRYLKYAAVLLLLLSAGGGYWLTHRQPTFSGMVTLNVIPPLIEPGGKKATFLHQNGERVELNQDTALVELIRHMDPAKELVANIAVYHTIQVPKGGEYKLTLEDGTLVMINSDSRLGVLPSFSGGERRVYLDGEAFFQVSRDTSQPFIVETAFGEINVLGTVFNVSAYPEDATVRTTLVEGSVVFRKEALGIKEMIRPGEQVVFHKESGKANVREVNVAACTAWTEGKWIIEEERLEDIMKQLCRWYNMEVVYRNPEAKELIFTGDLERYKSGEIILDVISMTTNVAFELENNVIVVKMQ